MNSKKYHINLSDYFKSQSLFFDGDLQKKPNIRKCMEQPWQQTKAELWDDVTDTLCNLDFIQAKAVAKKTYDLVQDFNDVLEVIPDNAENIRQEKARQERMDKYTRDLIACAKGEITRFELEVPESITPWPQEKIDAEIERIKTNPTRLDLLHDFLNFIGRESGNLQNYAFEFSHFAAQQAWNNAAEGPVGKTAENEPPEAYKSLLRRIPSSRPPWNPMPQVSKTFHGHTNFVTAVSITPDGKKAISGSWDTTCILWNLETGQMLRTLKGHTRFIKAVSITPDGRRAISGSEDNTCIFWDLNTGEALKILRGHTAYIYAVSITPDGQRAISGSQDNICILWDLKAGHVLHTLRGHTGFVNAVSITPDGQRAISGSEDRTCILWNLDTGQAVHILKEHTDLAKCNSILCVSITPDGSMAVSGTRYGSCILWDLKEGKAFQILRENSFNVSAISITPDGKKAISGSENSTCTMWNLMTGRRLQTLRGHSDHVRAVSIAPDGHRAISGSWDKTCILWDLEKGQPLQIRREHVNPVFHVSVMPDRQRAISASYAGCILWNLVAGKAYGNMRGFSGDILAISITPDGEKAITYSSDQSCILWDLKTGQFLMELKGGAGKASITPDGKRAFSGSNNNTCIFWDLNTGEALKILRGHTAHINNVSITPDGQRAVSISQDNTCILWDLRTGQVLHILRGHNDQVWAVSITPDGKRAISYSQNKTCIIWNLLTGQAIKTINGVSKVFVTPDGKRAISSSQDNTCILWDLRTGQKLHTLTEHTDQVQVVPIPLDGKRAISGSDYKCILWDLDTGKKLGCFISDSPVSSPEIWMNGIFLGCKSGEVVILNTERNLLCPGAAISTIRQIWDFELQKYNGLSADCPLCGNRFEPQASVLKTVKEITKKAGLTPDRSSCMELPDEAWEDQGLLGSCPKCGEELKFNPFIADGRNIADIIEEQNSDLEDNPDFNIQQLINSEKYTEALSLLEKEEAMIKDSSGYYSQLVTILDKRAYIFQKLNRFVEALDCYERSNKIFAGFGNTEAYADNLLSQAELLTYFMGEYEKAIPLLLKAAAVSEVYHYQDLLAEASNMLRETREFLTEKNNK